jgi:hydrogenase maturation protease
LAADSEHVLGENIAGKPITVIGCGNTIAADDGVGSQVVARLAGVLPDNVELVEIGVDGLRALDYWRGQDQMIVIDAVFSAEHAPGTVLRGEFGGPLRPPSFSLHSFGPAEVFELGRVLYPERMPRKITIIGVVMAEATAGKTELSPEVSEAVDRAVEAVLEEIRA